MTQKYVVDVNEQGQVVGQPVPYTEQKMLEETPEEVGVNWSGITVWGGIGLGLLILILASIVIVKQQTITIIERLGKFVKVARAGLSFCIP